MARNARIAAEVWTTPAVTEQYGLDLSPTAWANYVSNEYGGEGQR